MQFRQLVSCGEYWRATLTTCSKSQSSVRSPLTAHRSPLTAHCDVTSDYSTKVDVGRISFTNDKTHRVVTLLPGGVIEVDGRALNLNAEDRQRALELEHAIRTIIPDAKALAVDAVAIAFEAVAHVSAAFASNAHEARQSAERIARTATEMKRVINARDDWGPQSEQEISQLIEGSVKSLIGEMVGNIAAEAIKVALS